MRLSTQLFYIVCMHILSVSESKRVVIDHRGEDYLSAQIMLIENMHNPTIWKNYTLPS